MKKFIVSTLKILFLSAFLLSAGFLALTALTASKPAISETPKVKIQRGKVQELDSSEPSQLIELMAKDLHDKQVKARSIMKEAVENLDDQEPSKSAKDTRADEEAVARENSQAAEAPIAAKYAALDEDAENTDAFEDVSAKPRTQNKAKPASHSMPWMKTALSLAFVLSLIGVAAAAAKKYLPLALAPAKLNTTYASSIQILQSMTLGLKQQIMVILVEGHKLVIGVSGQNMNLLYAIPTSTEVREKPVKTEVAAVVSAPPPTPTPVAAEVNVSPLFDPEDEVAKVVANAPQNQFSENEFRKKLEAFERYQSDQAHIASLREKVREQMAAFSQRRETGEPVSGNVSEKIRSVMRSMKSFNQQNQAGNHERAYGRDHFQKMV